MILLPCPWCGPRDAGEFRYVGESHPRPDPATSDAATWRDYLYFRDNQLGWVAETWYHRAGCRRYLRMERHTDSNEVRSSRQAGPRRGGRCPVNARLPAQPGEVIDRTRQVRFTWNGKPRVAYPGDTIVSALAAEGERVFARSMKYHRPRGALAASFHDPNTMVQVGDEPNVRAGHRLVTAGIDVSAQDVWPSLSFDVKSANGLVGRFLTAGFYYKTFMKPAFLWPTYEKILRGFTHAGHISPDTPHLRPPKRYVHPDVLVAGGGPAGLAAALAAAAAGATVVVVEEEHQLGGHLRWGGPEELARLADLRAQIAAAANITVLTDSVVFSRYDGNWIGITERSADGTERLLKARAKTFVVAPGLIERPYVISGNDLPGVMLSTAVRRLINLYAVKPGQRAVVLTANAAGDAAVADLRRAGVEVAAVVDARTGGDVAAVHGRGGVASVELADGSRVSCDLFVTATGWTAPTNLVSFAGHRPVYSERAARFVPDLAAMPDDILVTGGLAGDGTLEQLIDHATATGAEAARRALLTRHAWLAATPTADPAAAAAPAPTGTAARPVQIPELGLDEHPALFLGKTNGFIDFSEDVSVKDIKGAYAEGYGALEIAKRFTTATMGLVQGKLETVNTVAAVAKLAGRSIGETGTTTWRPPYAPVTLAALSGRSFEPVRISPMQHWHDSHGGARLLAGAWVRPDHYGDPAAEVANVRTNVGIIDVTPIGKLDLRGPDVTKLLNLLYVNKWSQLGIGRVRYGVMCAEDGVVMDDGVTGRLGEEHYLMSTTSSGAATVWEWAENWLQTEHPDWRVHITPVTTSYASINVAGPRSRELMSRVVSGIDLENDAFPYMNVRTGRIAGVDDCVLWRIGFTGELSYEIHVPASYGLHVWETLLEAGADLGCAPFGIEAQRILRLEKGHLIVSQDTDALTKGYSAGLAWAIKLDKPDFAGLPELRWQASSGEGTRLVGLQPADGSLVPPEASQIVEGSRIVGRITSSRMSPTLGRSICLAQVESWLAEAGTQVTIRLPSGALVPGLVMEHEAHVDPDGGRMRV